MKFDVRCIKGPYWLPDEYPDADEHYGYDCTINGNKIIIGEEPSDKFRYVYDADTETYISFVKGKKDIIPLIRKAIEAYEFKQGLSKETTKTFNNIIDEL